ncbi:MAG: speH [Armatimonadetes bacterium]|jgi:S-adenosylmethionine decarboxylase|nr:speH [Armatimonadota bacterium]
MAIETVDRRAVLLSSGQPAAAGTHLLIDLFGAERLDSVEVVRAALTEAASACGATLLDIRLHHFGGGGGVTGVALLAESHLSIHSWPEHGYAAIDIFVCGPCDPYRVLPVLEAAFRPTRTEVNEQKRGLLPFRP